MISTQLPNTRRVEAVVQLMVDGRDELSCRNWNKHQQKWSLATDEERVKIKKYYLSSGFGLDWLVWWESRKSMALRLTSQATQWFFFAPNLRLKSDFAPKNGKKLEKDGREIWYSIAYMKIKGLICWRRFANYTRSYGRFDVLHEP